MPTRGNRRGVTLFESVAALAIVGLVSIAALEAAGAQMRAAERARRAVEAASLAQQRMDWLEFLNETQLRALPDTVKEGKFEAPLDEYSWETDAKAYATQAGVYEVAIHIFWDKREHEFVLRSYAYRRPLLTTATGARGARGGR